MPSRASASRLGRQFESLYRDHFNFVWRMALHFGVGEDAVEDVVQEVFVVVHRRWEDWREDISARSWLYGIVRRVAADHRRALQRRQRKHDALPREDTAPSLDRRVESRRHLSALDRVLNQLDPKLREVFVMAEVEELTIKAVAQALGLNPNTVYSRLRKARSAVASSLRARETRRRQHGTAR